MTEESEFQISKFWNSLPEKPSTILRFFEKSDYYIVLHEDAYLLAKNFYKSLEVIKFKDNANMPRVNVSKNNSDSLFRYLLVKNRFKVEVYSSTGREWNLSFTASPGNLEKYQDILFANSEISVSNNLVAINIKKVNELYKVFVGFVDLDNGMLVLGEFEEDYGEFQQLSNLGSVLFQLNCRECLIPAKDNRPEVELLRNTVSQAGLVLTDVDRVNFDATKKLNGDWSYFMKLISDTKFGKDQTLDKLFEREGIDAVGCLYAVVSYLSLGSDEGFLGFFDISSLKLDNYLKISEECSKALNIIPTPSDLSKNDSIYGLLNHCKTQLGERLLMQWLRQPLTDVLQLNNRLDLVELFCGESTIRNNLHDNYLARMPDIQRIIRRIQRKTISLQDFYKLYLAISQMSSIRTLFEVYEGKHKCILESEINVNLKEIINETENLISMIKTTLDFEAIKDQVYKIKPEIDESLMEKHKELLHIKSKMEKEFKKVSNMLGMEPYKQVRFESNAHLGYYLRITRKEEIVLRDKKNLTIKETQKDGVKFYSMELDALNEEYKQINATYEEFQKNIIDEMINVSGKYIIALQKMSSLIAKIDVLCSLSIVAISAPSSYVRPKLFDMSDFNNQRINLKSCRHPLVEMQNNVSYIPNNASFHDKRSFHIVTGPNMGGKSTYIRSVGLVCVLAQIGSFVPCEEAEIRVCDRIMTRIGAGDCQLKGVSTFMAEMLDVSWILKDSTKNSLIIIDELGRGTSTFDGFGLAWAISENLANEKKAFCLFATHFHELTSLADIYDCVANLHVTAQTMDDDLVFMYQLKEGPATKSYGIELAKLVGLPDNVIDMAREKLSEYEHIEKFLFDEEKIKNQKEFIKQHFCTIDLDQNNDPELIRKQLLEQFQRT